jgi:hypothetical protein
MDNVYIFDPKEGRAIAEIDAVVSRQWKLTRSQRPERAIMAVRASDYSANLMDYRNLVVVVSDVVPTWCGFIAVTPASKRWKDGTVYITLHSAEYLLSTRRMAFEGEYGGTAPTVFSSIIGAAEKKETMLMSRIDTTGGTNRQYTLELKRQTAFEAVNELANNTLNYWWIDAEGKNNAPITQANKLFLQARMSRQRAYPVLYTTPLVEGTNLVEVEASEKGDIANAFYTQAQNISGEDPIEVYVRDAPSISKYGLIEEVYKHPDTTTLDDLTDVGEGQLRRYSTPKYSISADIIATPYPKIGQKCRVELESSFWTPGMGIGWTGYMMIKTLSYSPLTASVSVVMDNIFWE